QFIIVHEFVSIMRDFLVSSVLAEFGNRSFEKIPSFLRFLQIHCGGFWKLFLEFLGTRALGQRSDRRTRCPRCFWKNYLWITVIGRDIKFIFSIARIDEEVKSTIGVLHFRKKIRFPFRLLQDVTLSIATLWQSQVVQLRYTRENIHREDEM